MYKNADARVHNVMESNREFYVGFCAGVDEVRRIQGNIDREIEAVNKVYWL
jgi:hypothetical protein